MRKTIKTIKANNPTFMTTVMAEIRGSKRTKFRSPLTCSLLLILISISTPLQGQNCSVNAGVPDTVCQNEPLFLFGQKSGLFQGSGATTWSQVGGPAVLILHPDSLITEVSGFSGGNTYTFRLSTRCADGSLVFQDVTKYVSSISTANAGVDQISCPGANVGTLSANSPGIGEKGTWSIIGTNRGVTIITPGSPVSSFSLSGANCGATTLVWTITDTVDGCFSTDTMIIVNRGGVSPVSAGPDDTLSNCYSTVQSTTLAGTYGGCGISGQQGTWTVITGPNIPTITNPVSNSTTVTNMIEGVYRFRWTVTGPCVSGFDEVDITVPPPTASVTEPSAGSDQTFCDGRTSTIFSGTPPLYVNETVLWEHISGPGPVNILSPNLPITQVTGLNGTSNYTFRYTIINSLTGCSRSDNVVVSYNNNPPTLAITQKPILVPCNEFTAEVPFVQSGSGITQYRILSGPPIIGVTYPTDWATDNTSPANISNLTSIGTYVVQMRRTTGLGDGCAIAFDEVLVITSQSAALSNAGTNQILNCNVDTTVLAGNDPTLYLDGLIGTWSLVSGPSQVTLINPNDPGLIVRTLEPGAYVFRWCMSGGPMCSVNCDEVTILVASEEPIASIAGPDQTVCGNSPLLLEADPVQFIFEIGTWSVTPNAGVVFSDINDPEATVTGLLNNTVYEFIWTVSNGCGSESDTVYITVNDQVGPIASQAGPDQCLITGTDSTFLAGNNPAGGTGTWLQVSGPNTATIVDFNNEITEVTGLINGTYIFEWVITAGLGCAPTRDTVMVTIGSVTPAVVGHDTLLCGNSITLTANTPGIGETGGWTQVSGGGGVIFSDPSNDTVLISGLSTGTYDFRWTITNGACISFDQIRVNVSSAPDPVNAGPDVSLCDTNRVRLSADSVANGIWTIHSGPNAPTFSNPTAHNALVSNMVMGTYQFVWNSFGGAFCPPATDTVVIVVVPRANAGANQSYCEAITTINLSGNGGSTGTWGWISKPAGTPDPTITPTSGNTAVASNLSPGSGSSGVYEFTYTISAPGCLTIDTMRLTLYQPPDTARAGIDQLLCDAGSISLNATAPVFGAGLWSKLLGPPGETGSFDDPTLENAVYTPDSNAIGTYVFQWTVSNGACSNADQVRIENYDLPSPANAGPDISLLCDTFVIMAADTPVIGQGTWTFFNQDGDGPTPVIVSPILPETPIQNLGPQSGGSPETYRFIWTVSNGPGCTPNRDTVTVTVYQTPSPAIAGPDANLCDITSYDLDATTPLTGTGTWTIIAQPSGSGAPLFTPDNNDPKAEISLLEYGQYVLEWRTNTTSCESRDTMLINVYEEPSTPAVVPDFEICQFDPLILSTTAPAVGTGLWSQVNGPNTANILKPDSNVTQVIGFVTGTYRFRYTISNGTCPPKSDTVEVTVTPLPNQALVGADQFYCDATSASLTGNEPTSGTGKWTLISGPNGVTFAPDSFTYNATVSGLVAGSPNTYTLRWTIAAGNCSTFDELDITTWASPTPANAGPDQDECNETSFTMAATPTTVGSGQWSPLSGPNTPLIVTPTSATTSITGTVPGTYRFIWTTINGPVCDTLRDTVTVINRAAITSTRNLATRTVCNGAEPPLIVTTSGGSGAYTYQWQVSSGNCSGPWSDVTGENDSIYLPGPLTPVTYPVTYYYQVLIGDFNGICPTVPSGCFTVTVVADPSVTVQPPDREICRGGSTTLPTTSTAGTGTATRRWQYYNGSTWSNTANNTPPGITYGGATGITLTVTASQTATTGTHRYRLMVTATGLDCDTAYSDTARVTVYEDPVISTQPVGAMICDNATHGMTVAATGGTGTFTYQWQIATTRTGTYSNVGSNSPSYTTSAAPSVRYYRVLISQSGTGCNSLISDTVAVYVPSITTQPLASPDSICQEGASTLSVGVETGDPTMTYSYLWQYLDGGNYINVVDGTPTGAVYTNQTTANLTISGIQPAGTYTYRVKVKPENPSCDTLTSSPVDLFVKQDPTITVQPLPDTLCEGGTHTMTVTAIGGTPGLSYQWQVYNGAAWVPASGTNNLPSYTTPALFTDTSYRLLVSSIGNDCDPETSDSVRIIVNNLSEGSISGIDTLCEGEAPAAISNLTAATGDGTITYRWDFSLNGSSYTPIVPAETGISYSPGPLFVDTWYRRVAISTLNDQVCEKNSNVVVIRVNNLSAGTIDANQEICAGETPAPFTSTQAGNGDGTITYQWEESADGTSFSIIPTATNATYIVGGPLTADTWYRRRAISGWGSVICEKYSDTILVTVHPLPSPVAAGPDQTVCEATSINLAATPLVLGTGTWSILSQPPTSPVPVFTPDANDPSAIISNLIYGTYTLIWSTSTINCTLRDTMSFSLYQSPSDPINTPDIALCTADDIFLVNSVPAVGSGEWTQESGALANIVSPGSATTQVIVPAAGAYGFRWTVTNGVCPPKFDDVQVNIFNNASQAIAGPDQILTDATSTIISGNSPTSPATGQWTQISGPSVISFLDDTDPTTVAFNLIAGSPSIYALEWRHVTGLPACELPDTMLIIIWQAPPPPDAGPNQVWCGMGSVLMAGNSPGVGTSEWTLVSGPNTPSILNPSSPSTLISGLVTGVYEFAWTFTNGPVVLSDTVSITIHESPSRSLTSTNVSCFNAGNGSITITATGGTPPYEYSINNGLTYPYSGPSPYTINNLSPGLYQVRVRDANGCQTTYCQ